VAFQAKATLFLFFGEMGVKNTLLCFTTYLYIMIIYFKKLTLRKFSNKR